MLGVCWHVAMRPGLRRTLDKNKPLGALIDQLERIKGRYTGQGRAPVPGAQAAVWLCEGRYRGLKKNTAQIVTLFALSNLWMVRHKLLTMGQVRGKGCNAHEIGQLLPQTGAWTALEHLAGVGLASQTCVAHSQVIRAELL